MDKTIHDNFNDWVRVYTPKDETSGEVLCVEVSASGVEDRALLGFTRPQLRSLIEALRQADAETRKGPEFIVRYSPESTSVVLLRVGSADEYDYCFLTASGDIDHSSKVQVAEFIRARTSGTFMGSAPIHFHGFPDEPSKG